MLFFYFIYSLLQVKSSNSTPSTHSTKKRRESAREVQNKQLLFNNTETQQSPHSSYKLENSKSLEKLLQRREADLQRRRDYVERLLQRHHRLDQEEIELQHLEQKLLKYNHEKQQQEQQQEILEESINSSSRKHCLAYRTEKMERHLKEIDLSMRELRSIPDVRSSSDNMHALSSESSLMSIDVNVVRTTGYKLNKLWRRLTSQQVDKYEPNRRYKLCKADVERLYEEAKFVVLNKFAQNKTLLAKELLDKSMQSEHKENGEEKHINGAESIEEESAAESAAQGNYHPSVAEENFNLRALSCTSTSSLTDVEEAPYSSKERNRIVEENVEKFMLLTNQLLVQHATLQRSSSDTQLSGGSPVQAEEIITEVSNTPNEEISTDLQENQQTPESTNNTVTESQVTLAPEETQPEIVTEENISNNLTTEISTQVEVETEQTEQVQAEEAYTADFETSADETRIEDISAPIYETTFDTTREDVEHVVVNEERQSLESSIVIPVVNKPSNIVPCLPLNTEPSTSAQASADNAAQLMPDIINELEIRRCQQIILENDQLMHYEHVTAMPYVFVREIPNKPPPPYVPPAHGSPMTTIFPAEERIKDITYRRTHELYCQMLKTDYVNEAGEKLPSVLDEKITNIYERIILDICCEYLNDNREVLEQGDPANFHSQLAFFNPPDRLRCLQESIHREVRRCLAMDKSSIKRSQVYSVYGQRAKRDHIDKIIIQELYDDDEKWCNFQHEEQEVLELMVEEMFNKYLRQVVSEVYLEECPPVPVPVEETQTETPSLVETENVPSLPSSESTTTAQD